MEQMESGLWLLCLELKKNGTFSGTEKEWNNNVFVKRMENETLRKSPKFIYFYISFFKNNF